MERVHAAVEAARALPFAFVLTARAENFWHGRRDMDDTIRRLQAFERAGADVLFAPGIRTLDEIRTVCSALGKPVNVVMSAADPSLTVAQLAEAGVRRISFIAAPSARRGDEGGAGNAGAGQLSLGDDGAAGRGPEAPARRLTRINTAAGGRRILCAWNAKSSTSAT